MQFIISITVKLHDLKRRHVVKNGQQYIALKIQLIRVFNITLSHCTDLRYVTVNWANFYHSISMHSYAI